MRLARFACALRPPRLRGVGFFSKPVKEDNDKRPVEEFSTGRLSLQRRVRISGWLMLDQMHPESVGRNRVTLWEVHPIMRVEWRSSRDQWISVDSLSPASDTR